MSDQYVVFIQGGIGPNVWDKEKLISAVEFQDATTQATGLAEELGGQVVLVEMACPFERETIESLRNQLAEAQRVMDAQSITITKLCEAIDPEHQHGPETEKICNYAVVNRETATQAKTGIILKCSHCNGLGQVFRYQVQDHIEYEKCHKCNGDGIDTDTVAKLFQLQQERDQLKQQLLASEASRQRIRDNILNCRGPLEGCNDNDLINAVLSILDDEPPQTTLTEALKSVREAVKAFCDLDIDLAFQERISHELKATQSTLHLALSELDKLCPKGD